MKTITRLLATGLYTGYSPVAPGTAGSVVGVLIFWLLPAERFMLFAVVLGLLFIFGIWSAGQIEQWSNSKDNPIIVIDEIVGMLLTLTMMQKSFKWVAIGFILFRLFDIIKPYPARAMEKLPRGYGVMMDDVIAGIYALVCLRGLHYLFSG